VFATALPGRRVPSVGAPGCPAVVSNRYRPVGRSPQIPDLATPALTLACVTSQNPDPGWQRPESARLVDPEDELMPGTFGAGVDAETTRLRSSLGGAPVPAGLYFVQLEALGARMTRRITCLRGTP